MLLKIKIVLLLCIVFSYSYGQLSKANHYYKIGNFQIAIPYYKKAVKKDTTSRTIRKLGDCYLKIRKYQLAEPIFKKLVVRDSNNVDDAYQYAIVLLSLKKYEQAITQFERIQGEKKYNPKIVGQLKFCKKNQFAKKSDTNYVAVNYRKINSKKNEFSPFKAANEFYYTAEVVSTDLYQVQKNQIIYALRKRKILKQNSPNVFLDEKFSDLKMLNRSGTNGAGSFSDSDQVLYYTNASLARLTKDSSKINRPAIFYSQKLKGKWMESKPFQWNNFRYSFQHPAISKDGKLLIFSSDMPGGFGKSDLYYCEKENRQWSAPKNLGRAVNTSENEVFPYLSDMKTLCFSSDGHVGYGGLDMFQCKLVGDQWLFVQNFGVNANSNKDDFGLCYVYKDSIAFFASNRDGGLGGDDIYKLVSLKKETRISANIYLKENVKAPAKSRKLYLLDSDNEKIDSTFTDQFGHFDFKIVSTEKSFMVEVDEADLVLKNKARYYIINNDNITERISHKLSVKKKYVFKSLPIDPNGLPDLFEEDTLNIAGKLFLKEKVNSPLANRKIMLITEFGDIVESSTTNEFGGFAFRNLPPNQNYAIYINDENLPTDAKILLTNRDGLEIKTTTIDDQDNLNFDVLAFDKSSNKDLAIKDEQLLVALSGYLYDQNKKALPSLSVSVLENEKTIQSVFTDSEGRFQTQKLDVNKSYSFLIEDSENKYEYVNKLYLADSRRRIYKEIARRKDGKFHYNLLNIDKCMLGDNTYEETDMLGFKAKDKLNFIDTSVTSANQYSLKPDSMGLSKVNDDKKIETSNVSVVSEKTETKQKAITIDNLQAQIEKNSEAINGVVVAENLNYGRGKYKINDEISEKLDKLVLILSSNPNTKIDINSHTDATSSDVFNKSLSEKRANEVLNYFISKGISRKRLKAKGFGETQLLNHCKNGVICDDSLHYINRRTEFKFYSIK